MRVVRKTILDKILALLPDDDILRIELTNDEFRELLYTIKEKQFEVDKAVLSYGYNESYVVIKGVCVQVGESYHG